MVLSLAISGTASAILIDRGGGLIYDSEQDITRLQNASLSAGSIFDDGVGPEDTAQESDQPLLRLRLV